MTAGVEPLVAVPDHGRLFTREREVRLGDADVRGRLRLDALACYLQDVANYDAREALGDDASAWVVRRTIVDVFAWPRLAEVVSLTTFLGGVGGRWAERRTSLRGRGVSGGSVECASLWVHIDMKTGMPAALPPSFVPIYGAVYGGRKVSGRLGLPAPPAEVVAGARPWSLRASDLDVMGHVNNAAYWSFVEDVLALDRAAAAPPVRFELEYKNSIEPDDEVSLARDGSTAWLVSTGSGTVHAAARAVTL